MLPTLTTHNSQSFLMYSKWNLELFSMKHAINLIIIVETVTFKMHKTFHLMKTEERNFSPTYRFVCIALIQAMVFSIKNMYFMPFEPFQKRYDLMGNLFNSSIKIKEYDLHGALHSELGLEFGIVRYCTIKVTVLLNAPFKVFWN